MNLLNDLSKVSLFNIVRRHVFRGLIKDTVQVLVKERVSTHEDLRITTPKAAENVVYATQSCRYLIIRPTPARMVSHWCSDIHSDLYCNIFAQLRTLFI
jgi:hypothetical protein